MGFWLRRSSCGGQARSSTTDWIPPRLTLLLFYAGPDLYGQRADGVPDDPRARADDAGDGAPGQRLDGAGATVGHGAGGAAVGADAAPDGTGEHGAFTFDAEFV